MTTTDPFADFDAARARLDAIAATARANAASAAALAESARTAEATVRSSGGEVSVTSRAGGVITAMKFSDAALGLGAIELARITTDTIARAQHEASRQVADAASAQLGASPLADDLRRDAEAAFPLPDADGLRY